MLSEKELKVLRVVTRFANYFCTLPYKWNSREGRYTFCDGRMRKIIWSIHNIVYILYLSFVFGRWIQFAFFIETSSAFAPTAMGTLYVFFAYNFVTAIQWSVWRNYGQHHSWINVYVELAKEFQAAADLTPPSGNLKKKNANCSTVLISFISAMFLVFVLDTLSVFAMPRAPWFISSLFLGDGEPEKWILWTCALFHIFIWIHQHATIYFFVSVVLCYLTAIKNILGHLQVVENCPVSFPRALEGRIRGQSSRPTSLKIVDLETSSNASISAKSKPMTPVPKLDFDPDSKDSMKHDKKDGATSHSNKFQFLMAQFSRLQAVQLFYNSLWSRTNCFYFTVLVMGEILACYGAVKFDGARAAHQFVVAILITFHLLHLVKHMGDVYETSKDVRKSWMSFVGGDPWIQRAVRSKQPLTVKFGGFFYADRAIKLTLLGTIFENTCSLLLSSS